MHDQTVLTMHNLNVIAIIVLFNIHTNFVLETKEILGLVQSLILDSNMFEHIQLNEDTSSLNYAIVS